jgi:hypothetical protein
MNKSAAYITFEEGFIKEAVNNGCDEHFLRGYIKQAEDTMDMWKAAFDELALIHNDPQYHVKIANEIAYVCLAHQDIITKIAGEQGFSYPQMMSDITHGVPEIAKGQKYLSSLPNDNPGFMGGIGNRLVGAFKNNPNLLSSIIAGGGGGGLIGLLLGALTGHPWLGLIGGATGGGLLSSIMGNTHIKGKLDDMFTGTTHGEPGGTKGNDPAKSGISSNVVRDQPPTEPQGIADNRATGSPPPIKPTENSGTATNFSPAPQTNTFQPATNTETHPYTTGPLSVSGNVLDRINSMPQPAIKASMPQQQTAHVGSTPSR